MADILVFQGRGGIDRMSGRAITFVAEPASGARQLMDGDYRIIFIDLEGAEEKGMEFACLVRGLPCHRLTPIVFFAVDGRYEAMAFHDIHSYDYMVKPIGAERIVEILYLYLTCRPWGKSGEPLRLRTRGRTHLVWEDCIVYVEIRNRSTVVHTVHEDLEIPYRKLSACFPGGKSRLVQCHRSILVNFDFVNGIDYADRQIILSEGYGRLDIGRKYLKRIRELFDD